MICQPGNVPKLHLGVLICKQCGSVEQCVSINDMRKGLCYKCFREAIERASPGKPVSRAEACRIAREVTEDAEHKRAEIAEREAQAVREQSPREIVENFLEFAKKEGLHMAIVSERSWQYVDPTADQISCVIHAFENQKEKP